MRKANATCTNCSESFYKRPSQTRKTGDFCSTWCYAEWRKNKSYKPCPVCKEDFHPKRREQKFCSLRCFASRPRKVKWNGKGKNHKDTLRKLLIREGWDQICMVIDCDYERTHDIHRLLHGKRGGKYALGNVFAICPNHHAEEHRGLIKLKQIEKMKLSATEE